MLIGTHLFAQDLDGVYFREFPKTILFIGIRPYINQKSYVYVYLNEEDSTMIYINTLRLKKAAIVSRDKYVIKYDNILFERDLFPLRLTYNIVMEQTILDGWVGWLEKANFYEVEQFIKEYGVYLKSRNICFQNGYAMLCDSIQATLLPQENKYEGIYYYRKKDIRRNRRSIFWCYSFNENQTILNFHTPVGSFDFYWEEKYAFVDNAIITEGGTIILPSKLKKADQKTIDKIEKRVGKYLNSIKYCICKNFLVPCEKCIDD